MAKRKAAKKRAAPVRRTRTRKRKRVASKLGLRRSPEKKRRSKKRKVSGPKVLKAVERVSVERTLAGKRRRRRKVARRKPVKRVRGRSRSVSGKKGNSLLVGLAIGVGAYLLLSGMNKSETTYPGGYSGAYGSLLQTNNQTRNSQSQDILNYATAAGLTMNAILSLIDRLNNSTDSQVKEIHDQVAVTGDVGVYV